MFASLADRENVQLHVEYASASNLPNVDPDGFASTFVPMRRIRLGGRELLVHSTLWNHAARHSCDVLVANWNLHYANLIPSLLRAKKNGVKTILWGHGYSKREAGWRSWPRNKVGKIADAVVLYNHTTANHLVDLGFDRDRTFVALNAIDQAPVDEARESWLARPNDLRSWQQEHGFVREDGSLRPLVLFVSRLTPANEVDVLLKAVAKVREQPDLADAQVAVIGKGDLADELRALGDSLKIGNDLHMPGAIYEDQQVAPWFLTAAASGAFCYPNNIGLSVLHAFGYGCAVVTGDDVAAQNPEIEAHRDGENGLLFRRGDPDDLAEKLTSLFRDADLRQRLSVEARKTAAEVFTLDNMVDGFVAAIRRVTQDD
ncbi:MAG: glycosyltransferase family 4 protein [Planctomycetota bacterium]